MLFGYLLGFQTAVVAVRVAAQILDPFWRSDSLKAIPRTSFPEDYAVVKALSQSRDVGPRHKLYRAKRIGENDEGGRHFVVLKHFGHGSEGGLRQAMDSLRALRHKHVIELRAVATIVSEPDMPTEYMVRRLHLLGFFLSSYCISLYTFLFFFFSDRAALLSMQFAPSAKP